MHRPVVDAITPEFLSQVTDDDLPDLLFQYVLAVVGARHDDLPIIAALPVGLRAGYVLCVLESEILNGGFHQFFTNSSGRHSDEALEYLRMIGAERHTAILAEASQLNRQLEAKYPSYQRRWEAPTPEPSADEYAEFWSEFEEAVEPEFDRLDGEFSQSESIWPLFVNWVRRDPDVCVHRRHASST